MGRHCCPRLFLEHTADLTVDLTASLSCASSISVVHSRYANLRAAPADVDFGSLTGQQLVHVPGASHLDVAVHVRPATGMT